MKFVLPELPYAQTALAPVISERTVHHHYEKHHAGYLKKLDKALKGAAREKSLDTIVTDSFRADPAVFNLAAQVWNHTFYWDSMTPETADLADNELQKLMESAFGSVAGFKEKFRETALNEFGSGWAWLLFDREAASLKVVSTTDAVNPLPHGLVPLLTLDVWEHAYYLDYQQARGDYVDGFLERLINWPFAASNLHVALADGPVTA